MGHEHRQLGMSQDVAGGAAEDHLPQSRLGVSALDQKVRVKRPGEFENGLANRAGLDPPSDGFGSDAVALKGPRQLLARWPTHAPALEREDDDVLSFEE